MKQLLLICSVPPGRNQWLLLLAAVTWSAVLGLSPFSWLPWIALLAASPWFLWQLPGASAVRLVAFPSALAFHMASSEPLSTTDLASVLFLFIAFIGFSLTRPPSPPVDFKPKPARGQLRGFVPVAFLVWSCALVLLMLLLDGGAPWILASAVFCAAHYAMWRRLARVGRPVWEALLTLVLGTALFLALLASLVWAGPTLMAAMAAAAAVWILGVPQLKTR